jgi:hypothetical protein
MHAFSHLHWDQKLKFNGLTLNQKHGLFTWSTTTLKTWSLYRGQMNGKTQGRNKLGRITQEVVIWRGSPRQVWLYIYIYIYIYIMNIRDLCCLMCSMTTTMADYWITGNRKTLWWTLSPLLNIFYCNLKNSLF